MGHHSPVFGRGKKQQSQPDPASTSPGWDAISEAMRSVHGPQEPRHWGDVTARLLGPARIDGLSAYDAGDHWHFVTLGLSEIWEKETDDRAVSGLGFEYTMRVRRHSGDEPPQWVIRLMSRLGETALAGHPFPVGHTLDPGGPLTGDEPSSLEAMCFIEDPTLPELQTPNGVVRFVQVVGITRSQLEAILNDRDQIASLGGADGLFVTPRR